jgi:hypothetical protein
MDPLERQESRTLVLQMVFEMLQQQSTTDSSHQYPLVLGKAVPSMATFGIGTYQEEKVEDMSLVDDEMKDGNAEKADEGEDEGEDEDEDEGAKLERRRNEARENRKRGKGRGSVAAGVLQEMCSTVLKELTNTVLPAAAELKLGQTHHLLGAVLSNNRYLTSLDLSRDNGGLDATQGAAKLATLLAAGEMPSLTQLRLGPVPEEMTAAASVAVAKIMGRGGEEEEADTKRTSKEEAANRTLMIPQVEGPRSSTSSSTGVANSTGLAGLELRAMIDALDGGRADGLTPYENETTAGTAGGTEGAMVVVIDASATDAEASTSTDEGDEATLTDEGGGEGALHALHEGASCAMRVIRSLMSHAALRTTIQLVTLELCNYCVGPQEAQVLAKLLVSMRLKLSKLNLSDNQICGNNWIPTRAVIEGRFTIKGNLTHSQKILLADSSVCV